jgi:hypothetical protein
MGITEHIEKTLGSSSQIERGRIVALTPSRRLLVQPRDDETGAVWLCDALANGSESPLYDEGDEVLVLVQRDGQSEGVVLGRIAPAAPLEDAPGRESGATRVGSQRERRVVIEADEELILRVGESSIRIARDGKVVIRGQHVLTRAKGTNRIKGGSVAIN